MKKLTRRAIVCLFLAALLTLGVGLFVARFISQGQDWATFPANDHLFSQGALKTGQVLDNSGRVLATATEGGWDYCDDSTLRRATIHAVGDSYVGTGAITRFIGKLSGYNIITGARTIFGGGRQLYLTIDGDVNATALRAMDGHKGTVAVYDYSTGQVLCMVSSPTYDPEDRPVINEGDHSYDGIYLNNFLSSVYIPGSVFKLVTAMAAIENIDDIWQRGYTCSGSLDIDGHTITCTQAHGQEDFGSALTNSCNCFFGQLAVELGGDIMTDYAERCGLTRSYQVSGIPTAAGSFDFHTEDWKLAWSGVGQGDDLVNPCALLIYMGSIANKGRAASPQLISKTATQDGLRLSLYNIRHEDRLLNSDTADILAQMMRDNVTNKYGAASFPGLTVGAKSGTAETDSSSRDNGWFAGFTQGEHTLAFVVYLEGGGFGSDKAARTANTVLQAIIEAGY